MIFNMYMSNIDRFFDGNIRLQERKRSSFANLTDDQFKAHAEKARYGDFLLTEAIRPSYDPKIVPTAGYRHDTWRDRQTGEGLGLIIAAMTREQLMDLFLDLLDQLGDDVDVILETNHNRDDRHHIDLYREHIDLCVLKSTLCDFEDVLLDDGCAGIAVRHDDRNVEVQF